MVLRNSVDHETLWPLLAQSERASGRCERSGGETSTHAAIARKAAPSGSPRRASAHYHLLNVPLLITRTHSRELTWISQRFLRNIWNQHNGRPTVGGVFISSRNGAPSQKG